MKKFKITFSFNYNPVFVLGYSEFLIDKLESKLELEKEIKKNLDDALDCDESTITDFDVVAEVVEVEE